MDGSSVWRPFCHRFQSKIVPEGMEMTSEEPRDSGGRLRGVSGASREVRGAPGRHFGGPNGKRSYVGLTWAYLSARRAGLLEVSDFDFCMHLTD